MDNIFDSLIIGYARMVPSTQICLVILRSSHFFHTAKESRTPWCLATSISTNVGDWGGQVLNQSTTCARWKKPWPLACPSGYERKVKLYFIIHRQYELLWRIDSDWESESSSFHHLVCQIQKRVVEGSEWRAEVLDTDCPWFELIFFHWTNDSGWNWASGTQASFLRNWINIRCSLL